MATEQATACPPCEVDPDPNPNAKASLLELSPRQPKREEENPMLKQLFIDGLKAEVVQLQGCHANPGKISDSHTSTGHEKSSAISLASPGDSLDQCRSVYHFLCAMYDLVQILENCTRRAILHPDINWYNVYCNPPRSHATNESLRGENGRSINEILGEGGQGYQCLLADLDHAMGNHEARESIVTPMFTPLEMTACPLLGQNWSFLHDVRKMLRDLFSDKDLLEKVQGENISEKLDTLCQHQPELQDDRLERFPLGYKVQHLPRQDMESVFWLMAWWLTRAQAHPGPLAGSLQAPGTRSSLYTKWINTMLQHCIDGGQDPFRAMARKAQAGYWRECLAPELGFLAEMMGAMGAYLSAPWPYIDLNPEREWPWNHAHTVMKMLLLKEILAMRGGDEIEIGELPRPVWPRCRLRREDTFDIYL